MALVSSSPPLHRATSINWFAYAAPQRFYPLAGKLMVISAALAARPPMATARFGSPTRSTAPSRGLTRVQGRRRRSQP